MKCAFPDGAARCLVSLTNKRRGVLQIGRGVGHHEAIHKSEKAPMGSLTLIAVPGIGTSEQRVFSVR